MIFSILIIQKNHDRMPVSSNTRVLLTATWDYFTSRLPDRFIRSPNVVKEAIVSDINDLVQEFGRTSSDGVGASFFAMRRLLKILQKCYNNSKVCFYIPFLRLLSTSLIKMYHFFPPPTSLQTLMT